MSVVTLPASQQARSEPWWGARVGVSAAPSRGLGGDCRLPPPLPKRAYAWVRCPDAGLSSTVSEHPF